MREKTPIEKYIDKIIAEIYNNMDKTMQINNLENSEQEFKYKINIEFFRKRIIYSNYLKQTLGLYIGKRYDFSSLLTDE